MAMLELVKQIKERIDNAMPDDDIKMDFEGVMLCVEAINPEIQVTQAIDATLIVLSDYNRIGETGHW